MNALARIMIPVALAGLLGATVTGCQSPEEKVQDYIAQARELHAEGKDDKAKVQLRNALKLDSRNIEAHLLMSEIAESGRDFRGMYGHLRQVLDMDAQNVSALTRITQLLMMSGDTAKAAEHLATLETLAPANARTIMLRGMMIARDGDRARAAEYAERAYKADPDDQDILAGFAAALLAADQPERSLEVVTAGLAQRPQDEGLRLLQFRILASQEKKAEAAATLRELARANPDDMQYWRLLALYHTRNGDPGAAEAALREAVDVAPQSVNAKLLLASYLGQRNQDDAITALKSFISSDGAADPQLKFALAETYIRRDAIDEAVDVYQDIAASAASSEQQLIAKNQLARIALKQQHKQEGSALIEEILSAEPRNPDALIARASVAIGERRTDDAITDLRLALRERPQADNALVMLAAAYLQNDATGLAEESLFQALEINPLNERAALQYAQLLMRKQDWPTAQKAVDGLLQGNVRSPAAERLALQLRLLQKDWAGATRFAGTMGGDAADKGFQKYVLAVTLQGQERHAESLEYFKQALQENPALLGAAIGAVRSYEEQGERDKGLDWLRDLAASRPDDTNLALLWAGELSRNRRFDEAAAEYRRISALDPANPEPYRALAALALEQKDQAGAIAALEQGLAAQPGALDLGLRLADLMQRTGNRDRAEKLYRELLERMPTLDVAANNLAVLVAGDGTEKARLAQALDIARRFENSENPWFADTLGWIQQQNGNPQAAVAPLRLAVKNAPDEALFQYHLAVVLEQLGDAAGARTHLERAEALAAERGQFEGYAEAMSLLARLQGAR